MSVQTPTQADGTSTVILPKHVVLENNNHVVDLVVERCEGRVMELVNKVIEAFGIAADDKAVEPIFEERAIRRLLKVHRFIGKILTWFVQDVCSSLKKAAAYNIAICCALFGGYQYYQNQKLLPEVKRTEAIRYILSGAPANKAMIEKIDTLLEQKGVDGVY